MRLFIAEKPSVARAIAAELSNPRSQQTHIQCGADVVTWCFGHLLEQAMPEDYDERYKAWKEEDLPIIPDTWKLLPKPDSKAQLKAIGELLKSASQVVNAGDPDREGQLLVDEVLEHFRYKGPVQRFWVSAQDSVSIKRGLGTLKDNRGFAGMANAAKARGCADWLIGMNLSRAFTLKAQRGGGERKVLSVGRVQTPTLSLVVDRDRAIEAFKPSPYKILTGQFLHANGTFLARWTPKEGSPGLDSEGRLVDENVAMRVIAESAGKMGRIQAYTQEPKKEWQPRAWSLTSLTAAASARFGHKADEVLKAAQSLYEQKLTSYPRTDCEYLPESQHGDAKSVLAAMLGMRGELRDLFAQADPSRKSKTWNDAKITAHHGIIPTQHRQGDLSKLSRIETDVYDLIFFAYLAQFFPEHEYLSTKVVVEVSGHEFAASGKQVTVIGWKAAMADPEPAEAADDKEPEQKLPPMALGDSAACKGVESKDLKTKPPKAFTEGTLLKAMENIHKFVEDEEHKKLLKEGDGIGTPATRASILAELKRRGFLLNKGKAILSTPLGRQLVDSLPDQVKSPVLTAVYERQLRAIESGAESLSTFLSGQAEFVRERVQDASQGSITLASADKIPCPGCKEGHLRRAKGRSGFFWGCSRWQQGCKATFEDKKGKPDLGPKKAVPCPVCGQGELRSRSSANGKFWGCNRYPDCRATYEDEKGKPVLVKAPKTVIQAAPSHVLLVVADDGEESTHPVTEANFDEKLRKLGDGKNYSIRLMKGSVCLRSWEREDYTDGGFSWQEVSPNSVQIIGERRVVKIQRPR